MAKKACMHRSQIARRQILKDARLQGLEPPKFKRGRPKMYATEEEAEAAHREQNRLCKQRYNARVLQALEALERLLKQPGKDFDSEDSSDEEKMFCKIKMTPADYGEWLQIGSIATNAKGAKSAPITEYGSTRPAFWKSQEAMHAVLELGAYNEPNATRVNLMLRLTEKPRARQSGKPSRRVFGGWGCDFQ